jgi:aromatic ring hydroxylase
MRTKQDYIKGLSKMKRNLYFDGLLVDRDDEIRMDCINVIGTTYDEAAKPENQDLCTTIFHLTGERINRSTHIHQNTDDLHKKQDMTRLLCQKVGGCIERCMGIDGTNAIYNVSYEADKLNNGTTQRIRKVTVCFAPPISRTPLQFKNASFSSRHSQVVSTHISSIRVLFFLHLPKQVF